MSTLEKFGILVILILVVIIGVVAVWGVGGKEDNPFASGEIAAVEDPATVPAGTDQPDWLPTAPLPAGTPTTAAPVPPPGIGAAPTVSALPPAPATPTTYKVQAGDTGAKIAQKTLGDANRWPEISRLNNNQDARRLKINQVLNIPSPGTQVASTGPKTPVVPGSFSQPVNPADGPTETAPAVPAFREIEVRNGDTLYGIAARELGNANLFYKIQKANPELDPKRLRPGMKVKVPTQ